MNINNRLDWLYGLRGKQIKLGLEPTRAFLKHISLTELPYRVIHIAGTNGKGSTANFIYKLLLAHGMKAGLYTSPHIEKFNERIRVNDGYITDDFIETFLARNGSFITETETTFFEAPTTMAFAYFASLKVDVVVVETGLGGRFDSTNVVDPEIIAITRIARDHENFLGNSLQEIAGEKLGIVKKGRSVYSSIQEEELVPYFEKFIKGKEAVLYWSKPENASVSSGRTRFKWKGSDYKLAMLGVHQADNASIALDVVAEFLGDRFSRSIARKVLEEAVLPARIEVISKNPLIIMDSAHNEKGLKMMIDTLDLAFKDYSWSGIMGIMSDKEIDPIFPLLKERFTKIWCQPFSYHRALAADRLAAKLKEHGISADILTSGELENIINRLQDGQGLVIFGTHYILADIRSDLKL